MTLEEAKEAIKEAYGDSEYTDEIIKALELQQEWGGLHDYMVKERIKQCRSGTISMLVADCLIKLPSVTSTTSKTEQVENCIRELIREFGDKHPSSFADYMREFNNHPISEIIDYMWDMHDLIEDIEYQLPMEEEI